MLTAIAHKVAGQRRKLRMLGCLALSILVSDAVCCDMTNMSTSSAITSLYADSDAVQYVCGEVQCTLAAFTRDLLWKVESSALAALVTTPC